MPPPTGLKEVLLKHFNPKEVIDMTTEKKVARRKLSLLELASDLMNVSLACKIMPQPGASDVASADLDAAFLQLVGHPGLVVSGGTVKNYQVLSARSQGQHSYWFLVY
jgi:hypothetical protein